ncbi:hypothetical protein LDG_6610 [Legionella drancourtii LLAP12]|uniref:Uncharacterized protein n=1 Tax=Legionella drancourtii LLAP12 TaxID=658187 RepID=G9EMZ0_9GAMM|nr:hypothetical protein LDG_6610 [Legionella drancourtii LLAP12]
MVEALTLPFSRIRLAPVSTDGAVPADGSRLARLLVLALLS